MKKARLPRKIKKQIPKGFYCYEGLKYVGYVYYVRPCPMFKHIKLKDLPIDLQDEISDEYPEEYVGFCKFLKYEIVDQCKSCGINEKFK